MGVSATLTTDAVYGPATAASVDPARDGSFDSASEKRDARPDRVQVITSSDFSGTDSFVIPLALPDGTRVNSTSFVRLTNATAAAIQADLRTKTGDTTLTVAGTTDAGPFTITYTKSFWTRGYPHIVTPVPASPRGTRTFQGTGCSWAVTFDAAAGEDDGADTDAISIGLLGESHRVSETDSIRRPTVGVITPTNTTTQVQTLTKGTATGGTFVMKYRGNYTGDLAFNITAANLQTALRALHPDLASVTVATDANPVITMTGVTNAPVFGLDTGLLTGGTAHTIAITTPFAFGSASAAYTEVGAGDTVLAAAVKDTKPALGDWPPGSRGIVYGVQNDAATPVVVSGLMAGTYKLFLRTVEDGRVSKASVGTFTIA